MLELYLSFFAVGAALLVVTLFVGDGHGDVDLDADADADAGGGGGGDWLGAWLPIASLRFWIFFAAFGGLTGTLFDGLDLMDTDLAIGITAGVTGYVSGTVASRVIRHLRSQVVDSSVGVDDYLGEVGVVELPIGPEQLGTLRVKMKGRNLELSAVTESATLRKGDAAVVYKMRDDGTALVEPAPALPPAS